MADHEWEYRYTDQYQGLGAGHGLPAEPEARQTRAVLWVPDPEQRHGWREYYVKAEAPKPASRAALGFGQRKDGGR
jgi:hypothetical protein